MTTTDDRIGRATVAAMPERPDPRRPEFTAEEIERGQALAQAITTARDESRARTAAATETFRAAIAAAEDALTAAKQAEEDRIAAVIAARDAWVVEMAQRYPQYWTPSALAKVVGLTRSSIHSIVKHGTNVHRGGRRGGPR